MMKRKKCMIVSAAMSAAVVIAAVVSWFMLVSPTRIAFVNYQTVVLGQIAGANDSRFVRIAELPVADMDKAGRYDMVFVNAMGLRITDEQRRALAGAAADGTPVMTTAATNPQNFIVSVDSVDYEFLKQYLAGGRTNYRNMLRYVRRFVDGKRLFVDEAGDPQLPSVSMLYYPSGEMDFASVAGYERFLARSGKWHDGAPHVILAGQMGVPDSLVAALEHRGFIVYPVNSIQKFIANGHADSVRPDAVINMAHGRMGDAVTDYLIRQNIPLFSPLNVNRPYQEWMDDRMGMSGGFLSQSVVTPEIDGAVLPYALFAHYEGGDGLPYVAAVPDRLDDFVSVVGNYIGLQRKPNGEKKIAVFYFKGPGQSALVAEGMDVAPSLYNFLCRLKNEGYTVGNLPPDAAAFSRILNANGKVFNGYAEGAKARFVKDNVTEMISAEEYDGWCGRALSPQMRADIDAVDGLFPGHGLNDGCGNLALSCLHFGNVVLIPQPAAGLGDDDFKIVHGTDAAPPHNYVAAYLWTRYRFGADAILHFGAHGSLEFTPGKQVALGSNDWSDRLVGTMPHFYVYSASNVGEAMIAKRRSYACIISHLTPPFMESRVRGVYKNLTDALLEYNRACEAEPADAKALARAAREVKLHAVDLGIHRDLRLDSVMSSRYTADEIHRIESFADELVNEKMTGAAYVMGVPYSQEHIYSTVLAMTVDPIAYGLAALRGGGAGEYRGEATSLVRRLLSGGGKTGDDAICRIAGISGRQLDSARNIVRSVEESKDMLSKMMVMGSMAAPAKQGMTAKISERKTMPGRRRHRLMPGMSPEKAMEMARRMGADEAALRKIEAAMKQTGNAGVSERDSAGRDDGVQDGISRQELDFAYAVVELERALCNVDTYRDALSESPEKELSSLLNALDGGFIPPSSGGDPVRNPDILPTGRNMFAVNAEATPSVVAWEKGRQLADNTIALYRKNHGDSIPRKVSYTLWSSEFIETEGATIAQVFYMLGVEPVRDPFGRVTDLRLIPSEKLGRPRIDVVVQTSGQLRDLAASRLFLINRAVAMAAGADDRNFPNYVAAGVRESEHYLVEKGVTPKEARELSAARVFGGVNGNYGSGIQSLVEAGDRWNDNSEIAATYISNMGAVYGSETDWAGYYRHAFEAALTRTDVVVQPRQSNTWGALSLDHVYEFMGGLNLAVCNVTGKEPEAYLSDYRNRGNVRMQEIKEAVGIESRTTILNPEFVKEKMKGGAGDAAAIADVIRNTYGWNVMKRDVIDDELWNGIYDVYVADKYNIGIKEYFGAANPAALQEMTAVMLETVRKGMWNASPEQVEAMAGLHTAMVDEYGASCSGFVCDNAGLRDFIASAVPQSAARKYNRQIADVRAENISSDDGMVMKREEFDGPERHANSVNGVIVAVSVLVCLALFVVIVRRRRSRKEDA